MKRSRPLFGLFILGLLMGCVPSVATTPIVRGTEFPSPTFTSFPAVAQTLTPTLQTATLSGMPPSTPNYCLAPVKGEPQDITDTPAAPYFVRHPMVDNPNAPTIVFIGGSSGNRRSALRIWANYLSGGKGVDGFRVVMPYAPIDVWYSDPGEELRTFKILDEVLACYGGDPKQVHIAGFSNGGWVAFELMLKQPERFATLLGAPGLFPKNSTPEQWAKALCGRAVFNGVGSEDYEWKEPVQSTHAGLLKVGVASMYVEFKNQGHALNGTFDKTVFFDFWLANGPGKATSATTAPCHN